ncbi:MAG: hypothetical protein WCG87_11340 [Bacteroidota bacterium]
MNKQHVKDYVYAEKEAHSPHKTKVVMKNGKSHMGTFVRNAKSDAMHRENKWTFKTLQTLVLTLDGEDIDRITDLKATSALA